MSGWTLFFIISLVLGVIVSNILLLKQTAKHKVPEHILKAIAERKKAEELASENEKPNDD